MSTVITFWTPLQHYEAEMEGNEMIYNLFPYHMSFQPSNIPSTTHHGSDFARNSKASLYVEKEFCVVHPCHKHNYLRLKPLEGGNLVEESICETHHLSGSRKKC